jgi:transcriptional regulator with XRE-family HTH domain
MTDRILALIKSKNVSPSQFADEIGVQRSSISHLISGRNKPSLEFVQKVLARYPEVIPEWLLNGTGSMTKDGDTPGELPLMVSGENKETPVMQSPETGKVMRKKLQEKPAGKIERIVYFFTDNTFREYFPE